MGSEAATEPDACCEFFTGDLGRRTPGSAWCFTMGILSVDSKLRAIIWSLA